MERKKYYLEIYSRYGNVRRARGHFLYTQKNVRLTDLFREEGRAILGWRSETFTVLKNALSKGLTGSFTTAFCGRLQKAVSQLLHSNRKIFVFSKKQTAVEAGLFFHKESCAFYKPLANCAKNAKDCVQNEKPAQLVAGNEKKPLDFSKTKSVILFPPLSWAKNIFILAVLQSEKNSFIKNNASENESEKKIDATQNQLCLAGFNSETLPPFLEAACAKSIYELISAEKKLQEKDFFLYDKILSKYWMRTGCYLRPKIPKEKYDDFVLHCLDCTLAISPDYDADSIVPFGVDEGVFTKLKNLPFEF